MQILHRMFAIVLVTAAMPVAAADYEAGEDFERIDPAVTPSVDEGQVEVVELFWYGCPHCYSLEPHTSEWEQELPEDVTYRRVPAVLNPQWTEHARAYYTAEALDMADEIHRPLFEAIHEERQQLASAEALQDFLVEHGADREEVEQTYGSFGVSSKVQAARELGNAYGMDHVPAVAVNGKYWTSPSMAGDQERFFDVVEHLIERERD